MDVNQLRDEIDSGEITTKRIQRLRDDLVTILDMDVPSRPADIDEWWESHKSAVSRKVNEQLDENIETEDNEVTE